MSVTVNMKKIVIVVGVLLIVVGFVFWFVSTKNVRASKAEYKMLVRLADKQAVEIAIIEQASKLANYKQQIAKNQRAARERAMPNLPAPIIPSIPDPVDIPKE